MTIMRARGGFLDRHIQLIREVYGKRRDLMLASIDRHIPAEVTWTYPQGGLFLWGTLLAYMDAKDLLKICLEKKVAFVPGESFHPAGGARTPCASISPMLHMRRSKLASRGWGKRLEKSCLAKLHS